MPRFRDCLPWRRAKKSTPASSNRYSSCAAEPPNLAEEVRPCSPDAAQHEEAPEPEPQQPASSRVQEITEEGLSSSEPDAPAPAPSLWDRAYIKLKESKPTLVADYEKLLLKELADGGAVLKKEQLSDIATRGLERVSEQKAKYTIFGQGYVVKDQVAQVSKLLINLKSFISDAIKVSPEASLAWAGACVILPLFSNPSTADEVQSSGFDYVTSRMRLYVGFEEFLWPAHTKIAPDIKQALETSVEDLYVKILTFQLTSVLRFFRGWLGQLGRDLVQFDDWKYMFEDVKKAEVIVKGDFGRLRDAACLRELEKMTLAAEAQCVLVKSLLSVAKMQLQNDKDVLKEVRATRKLAEANQPPLDLPAICEARYDSVEVHRLAKCLEGTRKSIQERITSWVDDETADHLFWLNGPLGTGKSTVSRTMAEIFADQHRLAASYFFSRVRDKKSELSQFFPTLASQLAEHIPEYKSHLREALRDISSEALVNKSPAIQFELLFTRVLGQQSLRELAKPPQLIIIDALDEFSQKNRIWELLKPLSKLRLDDPFRLCVLLTSRNTIAIDEGFGQLADAPFQSLNLHQEYADESRADIEAYLSDMFKQLGSRGKAGSLSAWPDAADMAAVVQMATTPSPLFLYASTLRNFLHQTDRGRNPRQQLKTWLSRASDGISQIEQTYLPVLQDAFQLEPEERQTKKFRADAANGHRIIKAVILAGTPVSAVTLAGLLDLELDDVLEWLYSLRAVFDVGEDIYSPVNLLHTSFSDFLLDEVSQPSAEFWVDSDDSHEYMALRCFRRMKNNGLKRDICDLGELGRISAQVEKKRVAGCIPSDLQYAVIFCFHHLSLSKRQRENVLYVEEFLRTHLLHWLEALSLLGRMSTAVTGMTDLAASVSTKGSQTESLIHDAYRFVLSHSRAIQTAPLQAYVSALIFSPPESLVKQCYRAEQPAWAATLSGMESHWGPCLMTIEPASKTFETRTTAALSSDGSKLAVVLSGVIRVYETSNWSVIGELDTQKRSDPAFIFSPELAFSPDGRRLAIAWCGRSDDATEIWDWETRIRINSFRSLESRPIYVRFCSNDEQLAHFDQSSLALLDITTNQVVSVISLEPLFTAREFKQNDRRDIISSPRGIELARIIAGQSLYSAGDHTDDEASNSTESLIAFSSDGELMARTQNEVLQLFSVRNGRKLATIVMDYGSDSRYASDLKFFDGNRRLAHATRDGKLHIWGVEPLALTQTVRIYDEAPFQVFFLDHRKQMISFACEAGSISVWDMSHPTMSQSVSPPQELVYRMRNWPSLSRMVTISTDGDFAIWDTRSALCLQKFHSLTETQKEKEFNTAEGSFIDMATDQQRLVFRGGGSKVRVLDLGMRPRLRALVAPTNKIIFKAISSNGAFLVFEMNHMDNQEVGIIHIVDTRNQVAGWPATRFRVPGYGDGEFIFSDDGVILVTYAKKHLHIWRLSKRWEHTRRIDVGDDIQSLALSPENRRIAVCHHMHLVKLWDATAALDDPIIEIGEPGQSIYLGKPALAFSSSGRFLCLRSTGEQHMRSQRFWDGEFHDSYYADPKKGHEYKLKFYHVANGKLELEHKVATAPTRARPVEIEDEGSFLVQTAYGIQKCGAAMQSPAYEGYGMSEDRVWILKGSTRVLFVPAAYRDKRPRVVGSVAILRHCTHILLLQLK